MRFLVVLLIVVAASFASSTFSGEVRGTINYTLPETDDILDTYAYNEAEQFGTIGASFDDYASIDDFNGTDVAMVDTYTTWGVTTGAAPTALEVLHFDDDGGMPSTAGPLSMDSYPATASNTGLTYGSYPIYMVVSDLSGAPLTVAPGQWIGPHRGDGDNWYPIAGTAVTGSEGYRTLAAGWAWEPFSTSLESGDLFKLVEGMYLSLERNTWAGIKNMF